MQPPWILQDLLGGVSALEASTALGHPGSTARSLPDFPLQGSVCCTESREGWRSPRGAVLLNATTGFFQVIAKVLQRRVEGTFPRGGEAD